MKNILVLLFIVLFSLTGCADKGLTLEEYRNINEVIEFEDFFYYYDTSGIVVPDMRQYAKNKSDYVIAYEIAYNTLSKVDIDTLGGKAKELHIIYTNLAYNQIMSDKLHLQALAAGELEEYAKGNELMEECNKYQDKADKLYYKLNKLKLE